MQLYQAARSQARSGNMTTEKKLALISVILDEPKFSEISEPLRSPQLPKQTHQQVVDEMIALSSAALSALKRKPLSDSVAPGETSPP
mmetsp:Transcript_15741/g.24204  ORF Transcript_15741/g.24204 Transcript_15741/m.24204 type:complete len:87 (+) Transcript_15741:1084-1344(+)